MSWQHNIKPGARHWGMDMGRETSDAWEQAMRPPKDDCEILPLNASIPAAVRNVQIKRTYRKQNEPVTYIVTKAGQTIRLDDAGLDRVVAAANGKNESLLFQIALDDAIKRGGAIL